jgi:hypothetical protein
MSGNIEQGAPEGIYSVKMEPGTLSWSGGADRAADRLWLAGLAMQALISSGSHDVYGIVRQAWSMADAMLEVEGK